MLYKTLQLTLFNKCLCFLSRVDGAPVVWRGLHSSLGCVDVSQADWLRGDGCRTTHARSAAKAGRWHTMSHWCYLTIFYLSADHPLWCHSIYQAMAKLYRNHLLHKAEKYQRKNMSQHLHVSLPSGTSGPHCNKVCRSKIRLLGQLRTHD